MDDDEYVPPLKTEKSDKNRKYLPLGSQSSQRRPKSHETPNKISKTVTSSFCGDQLSKPMPAPLPDIYTTCPELKTFKLTISLASKVNKTQQTQILQSSFNPNARILKPYVFLS